MDGVVVSCSVIFIVVYVCLFSPKLYMLHWVDFCLITKPYGVSSNSEWNSTLPSKLTTATISDTVISRLRDAIAETANTSLITMDGERDGGKGDVIRSQRWNKFAHVRVDGNGVVWVLSCAAKIGVSLPSLHDEVEEERKNDALVGVNGVVVKREKKVLMRDAVGGVLFAVSCRCC